MLDNFAGSPADYCPHDCPNCGGPAYVGGPEFPAKCVEKSCVFYDEDCYVGWIMRLDDTGDPPIGCDAPDYYPDELDDPLDKYGAIMACPRKTGESDDDFYQRLFDVWAGQ